MDGITDTELIYRSKYDSVLPSGLKKTVGESFLSACKNGFSAGKSNNKAYISIKCGNEIKPNGHGEVRKEAQKGFRKDVYFENFNPEGALEIFYFLSATDIDYRGDEKPTVNVIDELGIVKKDSDGGGTGGNSTHGQLANMYSHIHISVDKEKFEQYNKKITFLVEIQINLDTNSSVKTLIYITLYPAEKHEVEERPETPFVDVLNNIQNYIPNETNDFGTFTDFEAKIGTVIVMVTNIGMVVSVLVIIILGIKYMLASVEEKAEYKKDMLPWLIGVCLLFGIFGVVRIVQIIGEKINSVV